ncbi:menaquinone-dependent protoporphyrinogen oxidase [Streptacidiphilus sp. MAP12-16]|uniref:flavodoxin domain-containing protein n=1 Tax=Streptacidiphilus sp. MAP12-16 TaxID=3156300 RepID=UPI0035167361
MNILVGYASAHGSTRQIAERIAERIRECGAKSDVRTVEEVQSLDGYDAFVLGSAVHNQSWLPAAVDFVQGNAAALADRPVWIFSVGMPAALRGPWKAFADKERPHILAQLDETLRPRDHQLFSGAIAREHLPLSGRLMFRAAGCHFGDFRDWDAIDAWARAVGRQLTARAA